MNSHFLAGFADELVKVAVSSQPQELSIAQTKELGDAYRRGKKHGHKKGRAAGRDYKLTAGDTASQIGHGAKDVVVGTAKALGGATYLAGKGAVAGAKGVGRGVGALSEAIGSGAKKITESETGRTALGAAALALLARKLLRR